VRSSVYLFGGEYSAKDQFYHYKDLWKYDVPSCTWEVIEASGEAPSQRSGHRLVVWRHYIICFGGFYDVNREMKYYNDVHLYCMRERKWKKLNFSEHSKKPSGRSSSCIAIYNDTLYIYGGFAEVRVSTKTSRSSQMTDMWSLHLDDTNNEIDHIIHGKWEKVSIKGIRPINRTSMSCTVHKKRMIFFGGVSDASTSGMGSTTEDEKAGIPHNDMYAFDMARKQFYMMGIRGRKKEKMTKREKRALEKEEKLKGVGKDLKGSGNDGCGNGGSGNDGSGIDGSGNGGRDNEEEEETTIDGGD
jgi:hypothetical protein